MIGISRMSGISWESTLWRQYDESPGPRFPRSGLVLGFDLSPASPLILLGGFANDRKGFSWANRCFCKWFASDSNGLQVIASGLQVTPGAS